MNFSHYPTANWHMTESQRFALDCGVELSLTPKRGSEQAIRGVYGGGA